MVLTKLQNFLLQKLYTNTPVGNLSTDFVVIIASLCGQKLDEETVQKGSDLEKQLTKKHGSITYPLLEVDNETALTDSHAIAAYLARSNGKDALLGSNDFESAQVDQWMEFLRAETTPLVKAL